LSKFWGIGKLLKCCGYFAPEERYSLIDNDNYILRRYEYGVCPICGNKVLTEYKTSRKDGTRFSDVLKKRKAEVAYKRFQKERQTEIYNSKIQTGNKSNMGFRYGINSEIKNNKGEIIGIKSYAKDFNETIDKTSIQIKHISS